MNEKNTFLDYEDFTKEINFDFSKRSSIGVGGKAKVAFYPKNERQMQELLARLKRDSIGHIVVGNLTNVLPTDSDIDKVIISTKKMVESRIGTHVFVAAGVMSGCLLKACRYARKSGAEFLAGIPCTLGGALYMNAGVRGKYIAEIVENVTVCRDGQILTLPWAECGYSYKHSVFMKNKDVILGATLRLTDSNEAQIRKNEEEYLQLRSHLPKGKSMGCVFKNVKTDAGLSSAGEWIERAGLKGTRCGGAYISEKHANFIINEGNATSQDIHGLIERIKREVYNQFQIILQEEIQYLE